MAFKVGDHVVDAEGFEGIVVKIVKGHDDEDHGTVTVWQLQRYGYGADNCEHYPEFGCDRILKLKRK